MDIEIILEKDKLFRKFLYDYDKMTIVWKKVRKSIFIT